MSYISPLRFRYIVPYFYGLDCYVAGYHRICDDCRFYVFPAILPAKYRGSIVDYHYIFPMDCVFPVWEIGLVIKTFVMAAVFWGIGVVYVKKRRILL